MTIKLIHGEVLTQWLDIKTMTIKLIHGKVLTQGKDIKNNEYKVNTRSSIDTWNGH